jgi:hypothetical protein
MAAGLITAALLSLEYLAFFGFLFLNPSCIYHYIVSIGALVTISLRHNHLVGHGSLCQGHRTGNRAIELWVSTALDIRAVGYTSVR